MPPRPRPTTTQPIQNAAGVQTRSRSQSIIRARILHPVTQSRSTRQIIPPRPSPSQWEQTTTSITNVELGNANGSEQSDHDSDEDNMAHVSPSGDIETPETMSIETSQAILIQQLKRQLEEVRKETMERGQLNKPHEVSEQRKRSYTSSVSDVLEQHRAKKSKTSRSLPDPSELRQKMARHYSTPSSVQSHSSSPTPVFEHGYSTPEPGLHSLELASDFRTPEPSNSSGLIDTTRATQQNAYSPNHRDLLSQAKRYINLYLTSQDAFPGISQIRQMTNSAVNAANKDFDLSAILTADIATMLKHHMPKFRYRWKQAAGDITVDKYGLRGTPQAIQERVKYLVTGGRYLYKQIITDTDGKERYLRPFGHESITEVIHEAVFKLREGPARLHPNLLDPIPFETIAFAGVVILNCLDEYSTGVHKKVALDGQKYSAEYKKLLVWLSKYESTKPAHCHELQKDLFISGMAWLDVGINDEDNFIIDSSDELIPDL